VCDNIIQYNDIILSTPRIRTIKVLNFLGGVENILLPHVYLSPYHTTIVEYIRHSTNPIFKFIKIKSIV